MKNCILLFGFFFLRINLSFGQDENEFSFTELNVSDNRTTLHDENTLDRVGFGAYHSFFANKQLKRVSEKSNTIAIVF
jgi:hypothetical protein